VLRDQGPFALRIDAEDAAEGDVDAPEIALAIERRALEEAVDRGALPVGVGPGGAACLAEFCRQRSKDARFAFSDFLERVEHGMRRSIRVLTCPIQGGSPG